MTQIPQVETILVTGAGGKLGRMLQTLCKTTAHQTQANTPRIVFLSSKPGADITWSQGESLAELPKCDMIVALWGVTPGSKQDLAENVRLVRTGVDLATELGASRLVHLSSSAVYGPGVEMDETHLPAPINPYGESKLAMERAIAALPHSDDLRHICLRLSNVVGADSLTNVLTSPDPARMDRFPDGKGPLRSYVGARDILSVIQGLAALPASDWPDLMNVAVPSPVRMEDLLRANGQEFTWNKRDSAETQVVTLDVTLMQRLLPDVQFTSDATGLIKDWRKLETR